MTESSSLVLRARLPRAMLSAASDTIDPVSLAQLRNATRIFRSCLRTGL